MHLGDVRVEIGEPLQSARRDYDKAYFDELAAQVQAEHKRLVRVTDFHVAPLQQLQPKTHKHTVKALLQELGCRVYPSSLTPLGHEAAAGKKGAMLTAQFAHFFDEERKEERDADVEAEIGELNQLVQRMMREAIDDESHDERPRRIRVHEESLGYWGYSDCGFRLKDDRLFFSGARYELSGQSFDSIAFFSELSGVPLLRHRRAFGVAYNPVPCGMGRLPAEHKALRFLYVLFNKEGVSTDLDLRYRHGTGHTISDMLTLRMRDLEGFRIPDVVVYPSSVQQLVSLAQQAAARGLALVPFGGGTNVTHALWCSARERRVIVAVDMRRLSRVRGVSRANRTACVEAGATGKALERALAAYGLTTGHCPDSYEFSTLGGWIATWASGMKRQRYGNIEDIVLEMEVVTAAGLVKRSVPFGRVSLGSNPLLQLFGSEGSLGIVVAAVLRLHETPAAVRFDSVLLRDWAHGLALLKLARALPKAQRPASLRLVDNTQFRLSQTLKAKEAAWKAALKRLYVERLKGLDMRRVVAATVVYEGSAREVAQQQQSMAQLVKHPAVEGLSGGARSGKAGFNLTFAIAYLRDFLLERFGILAESFETFIPWQRLDAYKEQLHAAIEEEHARRGLRGRPFLSSRVSQVYAEGVCLYLYYGVLVDKVDAAAYALYADMEHFIKRRMLQLGGSLSHHHGIGQLRAAMLREGASKPLIDVSNAVKRAFDPHNVFCASNALIENYAEKKERDSDEPQATDTDSPDNDANSDDLSSTRSSIVSVSNPDNHSSSHSNASNNLSTTPSIVFID